MNDNKCIRVYANQKQIEDWKEQLKEVSDAVKLMSKALSLAGNEVRLNILYLIGKEEKICVCDLSDILQMKIPAISQHLRKLKDAGIIDKEKVAQTIFYFITPKYKPFFELLFEKLENKSIFNNTPVKSLKS